MSSIIAKAKAGLILDQPFFASILLSMPMVEDASVPTMATDGDSISFNPQWVATLSLSEVTFVLAHETLHCVFQHMLRLGNKNHNKWNIAADYVINDLLVNERIGTMPQGGLLDAALVKQGKGTAEGVYNLLPKDAEDKKPGQKGGSMDEMVQPGQTPSTKGQPGKPGGQPVDAATLAKKESEMRVKVLQAKNAAKMQGKLSAGLERLVQDVVRTETDWRAVLRRFFSERAKTDLSYARPKRRFLAEDIYLPSLTGEKLGAVVIAVDCSGSINAALLGAFEKEIKGIMQDTAPSEIKVMYFDSKVLKTDTYEQDAEISLKPVGGGGTAFSPIFEAIAALDSVPTACVILTDLMCNDFGDAPGCPVLWASTERRYQPVPFGEVIVLKEGK